ncbi:MAG TPA: hypothetical protein VM238_15435 [Phycisphaerae bacterium]|nr:hypothetical protein [Phycisphaerae bacterium]
MIHTVLVPVALEEARSEGWAWFLAVMACLVLVLLVWSILRRRLLRPMSHGPSDTTDAWQEAGRRFQTPAPEDEADAEPPDEDTP